jgi:hypothetical protein
MGGNHKDESWGNRVWEYGDRWRALVNTVMSLRVMREDLICKVATLVQS